MRYQAVTQIFFQESKLLLLLALPLIGSGMVETSVGFFSTVFSAHLGGPVLAAGALVAWLFATLMVIVWGTLTATSTLVARYYGAQELEQVSNVLKAGLIIAALLTIPAMLLLWNAAYIFQSLGQSHEVVALAETYLHALTWALPIDFLVCALLHFVTGIGKTKINFIFSLAWVPLNILCNYLLMFGKLGLPKLGIAGLGWGAAITFWLTGTVFIIYLLLSPAYHIYFANCKNRFSWQAMKELLEVGLPLGIMYSVEIGFFLIVTLIMGKISQSTLGANQIAFQYLWLVSMTTYCIAQAITVRMGHLLGENNFKAANYAAYIGFFWSTFAMLPPAILYWFFPHLLIAVDIDISATSNQMLIKQATVFLALAAIFQFIEAIRFAIFGALRALKDTRFTMLISSLTFWVIAIPLGYILALPLDWGGIGPWWAMIISQVIGAIILLIRYRMKIKNY